MELTASKKTAGKLSFKHLPSFARYVKTDRLVDFIKLQIQFSRDVNLPLLRFFENMTDEQMIEFSIPSSTELLDHFINNTLQKQIEASLQQWTSNELPKNIDKYSIAVEDITLVSLVRKKAFLQLLPDYTTDINLIIAISSELADYFSASETASHKTYIDLLKGRIEEHTHFISRITETSPGIIYVFDIINNKEVYANKMMTNLLGYLPEDWQHLQNDFVSQLIHPDDVELIKNNQKDFQLAKDGEIQSIKYRIKDKQGKYRWMRTYESVFKRNESGRPWQVIGIALDIDKEKRTSDELHKREEQLLEAQELADMGSITWNTKDNAWEATPNGYKILEMGADEKVDTFLSKVHPADREKVKETVEKLATSAEPFDIEFRYVTSGGERIIWSRGALSKDNEGNAVVKSTIMDVTERHHMLKRLQRSEEVNKKAQRLTHIGNWTWDLLNNKLEWSEELFRIYGLEPTGTVDSSIIKQFNHPEDAEKVTTIIDESYRTLQPYDFYYRIILKDGTIKTLHAIGEVLADEQDMPYKMLGTLQDVTEREIMIERLRQSEILYKQAQGLSHIGNWKWTIHTNELQWSDEMYRIYGMEPQSEKMTIEKFKSFIHPDYKQYIEDNLECSTLKKKYDDTFRIITPDGEKIIHSIAEMQCDEKGNPLYVIGTEQDITEKHHLLEQLKKSEALYKEAEILGRMGSWSWNVKENRLYWSDEIYRLYDLEPQSVEVTFDLFKSYIHPEDFAYATQSIQEAFKTLKLDYTYRILLPDGDIRYIHSIGDVKTDAEGNPDIFIGSAHDVTEKQLLIEQIEESRELYKQALSIAKIGNWTWDVKTDVVFWDEQIYRNFGMEPFTNTEPITFDLYMSFIPDSEKQKVQQHVAESLKTKKGYEFIHKVVTETGEEKYLLSKGEVLLDENGDIYKLLGTAQDVTEREKLIEKLQRSEALYKQAQAIAHLGNWIFDVAENKLYWTDELYRIYGMHPQTEGLTWDRFMEFVLPEDRQLVSAFADEALKNGNPFEMYHRNILSDGTVKTVHVKGEGVINDEGMVYQLYGTTQDVTEQQKIEQQLRENQNFIQKIADATPSVITSYNINTGKYHFISQGLEKLLGYDPKEALERGMEFFSEIIHPDDLLRITQENIEALSVANSPENEGLDIVVEFQYRMKKMDGEYRWFHTFGTVFDRNPDGKVENILNISIDITQRIQAEERVIEQERFIKHIAEASPTILYLFDLEKRQFLYVNKEVAEVLGYAPEEITALGDKVYHLLHPEDDLQTNESHLRYKSSETAPTMHQFEGRIKSRTGDWRWLLTREIVFKRDESGRAIQVLGSALDITERKEMERNLSRKNLELEQSNASLEEFAYVASHDLQEPLRKISIFGDRLLSNHKDQLNDDGRNFLNKIVESSRRMQMMINDLLSLSLISGDKHFEKTDLNAIVRDVLQTLELKIEKRGAVVNASGLPTINVVPFQFRQLFQNLISNSLKFSVENRSPVIKITSAPVKYDDLFKYNLPRGKQYVTIQFEDNGIGFDNKFASKIFTIFQRLHGKSEYEGSGIGLAICKKIVENHEGVIFAEGKPGEGSIFSMIIPA